MDASALIGIAIAGWAFGHLAAALLRSRRRKKADDTIAALRKAAPAPARNKRTLPSRYAH